MVPGRSLSSASAKRTYGVATSARAALRAAPTETRWSSRTTSTPRGKLGQRGGARVVHDEDLDVRILPLNVDHAGRQPRAVGVPDRDHDGELAHAASASDSVNAGRAVLATAFSS